jgi:hypothetical protein
MSPYKEITLTVYDSVNGCSHGYTFCMTFYSQMGLNYPGWYYHHKEFALVGAQIPHEIAECHFRHRFSVNMWFEVSLLLRDINSPALQESSGKWIRHAYRRCTCCNTWAILVKQNTGELKLSSINCHGYTYFPRDGLGYGDFKKQTDVPDMSASSVCSGRTGCQQTGTLRTPRQEHQGTKLDWKERWTLKSVMR